MSDIKKNDQTKIGPITLSLLMFTFASLIHISMVQTMADAMSGVKKLTKVHAVSDCHTLACHPSYVWDINCEWSVASSCREPPVAVKVRYIGGQNN